MDTCSFYSAAVTDGGPVSMRALRFIDKPIARALYDKFARVCQDDISFGEIDAEQILALLKRAHIALAEPGTNAPGALDIHQAHSIRRHVIRQYNITNTHRIGENIDKIAHQYDDGASVLAISEKLRLSPYVVFRALAIHKLGDGASAKINLIAFGTARASDLLDERMAREYETVREYDYESAAVQMRAARDADLRESNFIKFLRDDLKIKLKTQTELFEEAKRENIHPVTPDALFIDPVKINGARAYWVDFKSYCGTPVPFLSRSTKAQHDKYCARFGPGAIIYEDGFVAGLPYHAVSARALRDVIEKYVAHPVLAP